MKKTFAKASFARSYIMPALLMFAIPALGYLFAQHANRSFDARFMAAVTEGVSGDAALSQQRKQELLQFYADNPASRLCAAGPEGEARLPSSYVEQMCGDHMQITWIERASLASILGGLCAVLFVLVCVGLSFTSRRAQYLSFLAGWNFLRVPARCRSSLRRSWP